MNIYTRFKLYNALVLIIGSVIIMLGVDGLFCPDNWASEGYRSRSAKVQLSFFLILTSVLFTAYFLKVLQIPKKQIGDSDLVDILREKEKRFLLGILCSLTAALIIFLRDYYF